MGLALVTLATHCWRGLALALLLTADLIDLITTAFCILQLYKPYTPRPHNKANLCCTKLRLAGCEPHMSGRNPFYLLKIFLLTAQCLESSFSSNIKKSSTSFCRNPSFGGVVAIFHVAMTAYFQRPFS